MQQGDVVGSAGMSSDLQVFQGYSDFKNNRSTAFPGSVVTIGNFDGLHLGHQRILFEASAIAKKLNAEVLVFTFIPHPRKFFKPTAKLELITRYEERRNLVAKVASHYGISALVEQSFDHAFSELTADDFYKLVLIESFRAKAVVVGYDFCFGKNRQGNEDFLKIHGAKDNLQVISVPPLSLEGEVISSSIIRKAVHGKDFSKVKTAMGRPFSLSGKVISGLKLGRKLGFPTANFELDNSYADQIKPEFGVYITQLHDRVSGKIYPSVTNIGIRPTVSNLTGGSVAPLVETFCLFDAPDLYGVSVEVQFLEFIREEKKFPSVEIMKAEIAQDVNRARAFFKQS